MKSSIDKFDIFCNKLKDSVYHYTSIEAIDSILSNRQIWMTHYTKVKNDEREILTGLDAYHKMIKYCFDSMKFQEIILNSHFFISSFTKSRDSADHWNEYGDFCLEVTNDLFDFIECVYETEKHNKLLEDFIPNIKDLKKIGTVELNILLKLLLQMKGNKYVRENEVRHYTIKTKDDFKYRSGDIPYIEEEIDLNKVVAIWIGPNRNKQKSRDKVKKLLQRLSLDHIEIKNA